MARGLPSMGVGRPQVLPHLWVSEPLACISLSGVSPLGHCLPAPHMKEGCILGCPPPQWACEYWETGPWPTLDGNEKPAPVVWVQFLYFSHSDPHTWTPVPPMEGSPARMEEVFCPIPLKEAKSQVECPPTYHKGIHGPHHRSGLGT